MAYTHTKKDTLALAIVIIGYGLFVTFLSSRIPLAAFKCDDLFFNADIKRVVDDMTVPTGRHSRLWVHPLFLLFTQPFARALMSFSLTDVQACMVLVVGCASTTGLFLYLTCRNMACSIVNSLIVVALFASTTTFMYWWAFPETFCFAGMSMVMLLYVASRSTRERCPWRIWDYGIVLGLSGGAIYYLSQLNQPEALNYASGLIVGLIVFSYRKISQALPWIGVSILVLGITVSNIVSGLITMLFFKRLRDVITMGLITVLACCALSVWQHKYSGFTDLFFYSFNPSIDYTGVRYEVPSRAPPNVPTLKNIVFLTAVAPENLTTGVAYEKFLVTSGSTKKLPHLQDYIGIMNWAWIVLLAVGMLAGLQRALRPFALSAVGTIMFTWIFHTNYHGNEVFLYAGNYVHAFCILIALSLYGRLGRFMAPVIATFVIFSFIINLQSFLQTTNNMSAYYAELETTKAAPPPTAPVAPLGDKQ